MPSPADAPPLLAARGLEVGYRGRAILPPVDLAIRPGELWALVGRNGGGKTTLLRTLLGLLPRIRGALERGPAFRAGYVPQRSELDLSVPMRVLDLVRDGLDTGWSFLDPLARRRGAAAAEAALADTATTALARHAYAELSEGQKQRALLARALASSPSLLVLDEPTSAMDLAAERAVFDLLDALRARRDLGVLVVGHHLPVLLGRATHVALVDKDDGLAEAGPLDEVARTAAFQARYAGLAAARTTP